MSIQKELVGSRSDENFRKGACHGSEWLLETSRVLVAEGRDGAEVSQRLEELVEVLALWRQQTNELPDGNPWDWSYRDLASVIKAIKSPDEDPESPRRIGF